LWQGLGGKRMFFNRRPAEGRTGVAESVRSNPVLEDLFIYNDWFGDDDAEELAAALAHKTSLISLVFSDCSFGERGLRVITEALKTNTVIEALLLTDNLRIGDAGAELLADLLVSTSSLMDITIQGCGVGEIGARVFADALKINTTLEAFRISGNKIGDAGAAAIADALATTTSLTDLNLGFCGIGKQGALALARAWGSNLALSMDFKLFTLPYYGDTRIEAVRVRASVLRRRELLLAFGMAMLERLGGGTDEQARSTTESTRMSAFHRMNKDVFKLVGEAYGDY